MAGSEDLIDFSIIENQKENIQSLPSGRSAKALAAIYSPLSLGTKSPTPSNTQNLNDAIRAEYERELLAIADSDDPLDIYDRYVKWTLDAYPSAQATPQSQLLPLLERATKAFLNSSDHKNDPRYLKLWLHYIRLFSDTPRETFAFLSRHNVGEHLALFYEEFAAWLEGAGRWKQAEEVYAMGIEREARPKERLIRKYGEFQHRMESRPAEEIDGPSSPALPTVRPALAAKVDPFSSATPARIDPQAASRSTASSTSKPGRQKFTIFSDTDNSSANLSSRDGPRGWDSIGTISERKKENTVEARPWAGETLKAGKKNTGVPKMMIFKDMSELEQHDDESTRLRSAQQVVNPRTGRTERVFVNLEMVYPDEKGAAAAEFSFEELRARHRGWLDTNWKAFRTEAAQKRDLEIEAERKKALEVKSVKQTEVTVVLSQALDENLVMNDENTPPNQDDVERAKLARRQRREEKANRTRKIKVMEVREIKGETQTIQTNLASPTGPKLRKKKSAEPTMTFHTREAMDEIYGIFNQPLQSAQPQTEDEESEDSDDDDDYTSGGESTGTGRISGAVSEYGDETTAGDFTEVKSVTGFGDEATVGDFTEVTEVKSNMGDEEDTDVRSVSEWSEFTASKHVPKGDMEVDEVSKTNASSWEVYTDEQQQEEQQSADELITPTTEEQEIPPRFVPLPPEGCENAPTRPFRDRSQTAQHRLPFMTPIVEKTESSLGTVPKAAEKDYFSKTPSRRTGAKTPLIPEFEGEPLSSPFQDILNQTIDHPEKVPQPVLTKTIKGKMPLRESIAHPTVSVQLHAKDGVKKGPIIQDAQCNPVDEPIRKLILSQIQPPLNSYDGYFDRTSEKFGRGADIRKFAKAVSKMSRNANDKTATNLALPPVIQLGGSDRTYTVRRELGKGAFAPVYLVESNEMDNDEDENLLPRMGKGDFGLKRGSYEAIKMEDPPSAWEFYIMRQVKRRLGVSRSADSVIHAYEMHLFQDEAFLIEEYRDQGTLLNLINIARADISGGGVTDEQLVMFFTIELLRTVEALHSKGLIHGDLKADNVLVRLDNSVSDHEWSSQYNRDGTHGWDSKGISLIDFGRGIDMKVFKPDVQFIADWKTTEADCAEMRDMRPWTYQVDYHGLASIVHALLFGKYIETVPARGGILGAGATKTYKIRESLKRYWQTEIWNEVFDLLLNPLMHLEGEEGRKLPVLKGMKMCRERMEEWLENNCERGIGLKALVRKMENAVRDKRR
ncbi:hypothetical protein M501DRAFT_1034831 [Patellaria atrata CBS 101060]|uniref:Uncharacterized protein n=1 Tax=Patellaria atrata CBS 101060 TaxID=1346257 RepID=A0A9P4VMU4_9PEZI|nr:hypothetical protein M501DRAFT_1034831 [Patellaria atrata CBS 101060]